jgi:hypothetical protein
MHCSTLLVICRLFSIRHDRGSHSSSCLFLQNPGKSRNRSFSADRLEATASTLRPAAPYSSVLPKSARPLPAREPLRCGYRPGWLDTAANPYVTARTVRSRLAECGQLRAEAVIWELQHWSIFEHLTAAPVGHGLCGTSPLCLATFTSFSNPLGAGVPEERPR